MHERKMKGDIGVAKAIAELTVSAFNVAIPLSEHQKYDLLAEKNGEVYRIQVRYSTASNGVIRVKLKSCWNDRSGTHYIKKKMGDYDLLVIYCPDTDKCYFVREEEITQTDVFSLRFDSPKNNQKTGIRKAEDYLVPSM